MHISGHVHMAPDMGRREWTRTSFVASFQTFMGETSPHPHLPDTTVAQLHIKQYDFDNSTYLERWVCVPDSCESVFREMIFPDFFCQIQGDYSLVVTDVNVPMTGIWCKLLEQKPT